MATPPFTVPILIPLTHPFWISQMGPMMTFLRGNAKPCSKAVVSPQPVSHLSEEPSSDEDDEDLKGGLFTTPEVEKIKAEYAAFDKQIVGLAREMGHSVNSIQKIAILPTLTIHPAYDELIKKYEGEKSEDWAAESACLVKEYTETRAAISADITKHGGEVVKIIASHKRAWQKDFRALESFGNGQLFGTAEMESYYKSRVRKAEEHKAQTLRREQEEAFKTPNKAKGKVLKMLIQLFGGLPLITDSGGQVLMTVASALEMIGAKKKLDSKRAAEQAVGILEGILMGIMGDGRPVRNPSHTVMVNLDRIVTQGLGKRPWKCNKVPPSSGGHLLSYLDKVELTGEGVGIGRRGEGVITPPLALASGGGAANRLSTGFALDTGEKDAKEGKS
ncbi:hypothetical protein BS47DRAFT_1368268 [Hydnum rufescens UP504]|uniref:Uncharacterized protein n=1 Tax=Hydnum rufescens UP504 TaxID=1448309 RepID=A0A9P6AH37_9AGAM|nr:hypothetical protein BS47DRAFT_1368268 [Hydnum rufescens UP504]